MPPASCPVTASARCTAGHAKPCACSGPVEGRRPAGKRHWPPSSVHGPCPHSQAKAELQGARLLAGAAPRTGPGRLSAAQSHASTKGETGGTRELCGRGQLPALPDKGLRGSVETLFGSYSKSGGQRAPTRCSLPQFPCK